MIICQTKANFTVLKIDYYDITIKIMYFNVLKSIQIKLFKKWIIIDLKFN